MHLKAVLALLLLFSVYGTAFSADTWYNPAWQYRRAITLSEARNITRINEPVYATIAGTDGRIGNCTKELRITDASNAEIPSQVDSDSVAGGTYSCTAVFIANSSALGSNTYYAYYGNPSAAAPSYPSLDASFSVTASLLKNSYYNLPIDSYGFIYPSFSSAGSGSYDITMATGRPYCDNQRWMFSLTQNGTGYSIGSGGGCTNPATSWSVGKNGAVFKEVQANFATNPSATYYWRTRLFPKSRFIEVFLDARLSAPVNLTDASMSMVPGSHSTAWDQYSSVSSTSLAINTNSSWGTYGSGSVIYGNVRNVTVSRSYAGWEGGVGLHHAAYLLGMPSNVLTCASYPCTYTYSFRLAWTTDYSVAANRITGSMLDSPLSVSVGAPQSFFISAGISPAGKTTYPNTNETFSLWLNNNQSVADNFTLSCTGTCYYSENPVAAGAGQNKSVSVTMTSAGVSGTTAYTITATSAANASNFAAASASLTVDATTWRSQWVDAYGNEFRYRTPVTVSNNGSALTDYQVPINITNLVYNNTGLVGSWHFSEGAGTRFVDSSGNGNDGTYNGEALNNGIIYNLDFNANSGWFPGKYGKALRFDGSNDYISVPDSPSLRPTKWTIGGWIYPTSNPSGFHFLIFKEQLGNGGPYDIRRHSDGSIEVLVEYYAGSNWYWGSWKTAANAAPLNQWTRIDWTWGGNTGSSTDTSLYINGTAAGTMFTQNSYASVILAYTALPLLIAKDDGGGRYFNGSMDDVSIYNRVLSASEVAQLYQNNTFIRSGLAAYWRFDEGSGTIAQDTHHLVTPDNRNGTKAGNALSLDGINDYVDISDFAVPATGTLEMWIRPDSAISSTAPYMKYLWSSDNWLGLAFCGNDGDTWDQSNKGKLCWKVYDGTYERLASATAAWNAGQWYHVAVTWGSSGAKMYVNGAQEASDPTVKSPSNTNAEYLGWETAANHDFNGTIDEVRIYNRSLTAQEIQARYSAGKLKLDYDDLRFTNSSISQLPYWIESDNRAWVKAASIPAGTSTIYAYYGNPNATGAGNGSATFDFFDDFEDGVIDTTARWNAPTSGVTEANGVLTITVPSPAWGYRLTSRNTFANNIMMESKMKADTASASYITGILSYGNVYSEATNYETWFGYGLANNLRFGYNWYNGVPGSAVASAPIAVNSYYIAGLAVTSSGASGWKDYSLLGSTAAQALNNRILDLENTAGTSTYDWVRVRKFAAVEPSLSLQNEEIINPALFIGISPTGKTTYPNYNETFSLWVYNNQTVSDTFALSCAGACSVSPTSLPLSSYQNGSATVTITSANASGTTAYTITATSQSNTSNSASISPSLTVDATRWRDNWTDAYGSGFKYRTPITINNSGSALMDYQVNITIDTATPIGLARMRGDCGDLRLMNGTNEMPYWIEAGCNTSTTKIWARVPLIPNGIGTIYAHYGNPSEAYNNSLGGVNTFVFFDDFNYTGAPNANKWTERDTGSNVNVANGMLSMTGYGGWNNNGVVSKQALNRTLGGYTIEMRYMYDSGSQPAFVWGYTSSPLSIGPYATIYLAGNANAWLNGGWVAYATAAESPGVWLQDKVTLKNSTDVELVYKGESKTGTESTNNGYVGMQTYSYRTYYTDWVVVRKYAAAGPSALSGAEQSKGYRTLVRRCGAKQANATVTAYQAGSPVKSCVSDPNGICSLEISAGTYDLQIRFQDNSTAWKNGTVFG